MQHDTHANYTPQLAAVGCTSQVHLKSLPGTIYYAIRKHTGCEFPDKLLTVELLISLQDTVFESEQSLRWCCG